MTTRIIITTDNTQTVDLTDQAGEFVKWITPTIGLSLEEKPRADDHLRIAIKMADILGAYGVRDELDKVRRALLDDKTIKVGD